MKHWGGAVTVISEPGAGAEFIVTLPLRHDMAEEDLVQEPVSGPLNVSPGALMLADDEEAGPEVRRILIVEDSPEVAHWEMRQLSDSGYAFFFAADGEEGLRKAEEVVPDIIITDVMMPVMDGLEMCRRIRMSELLCHIPVVMVTARATHEDRLKGLEAGADAYMEKPYDENELDLRISKLLQQRDALKKYYSDRFDACGSDAGDPSGRTSCSVTDRIFMDKFDSALEDAFAAGKVDCEELASVMCIGRVQLNRKLKAITGYRTTEYILMVRLAKAKELLRTTDLPVGEIAMRCGVDDVGYFSTLFRKHVGVTPSVYRNS